MELKPKLSVHEMPTGESEARKASYRRKSSVYLHRTSRVFNEIRRESIVAAITFWQSFRGLLLSCLAASLFSINDVMVKSLTGISPSLIALFRFGGMGLFSLAAITEVTSDSMVNSSRSLVWAFLRGMNGAISLFLYYVTLQLLPLANAIIITLSIPVFVCVFAHIFLREPCGIFHVVSLTMTLVGIAFTARLDLIFGESSGNLKSPTHRTNQLSGLASGLGSALTGSLNFIIVRKIKHVHHLIILSNYAWVAATGMAIITYFMDGFELPDNKLAPWLLMMMGMVSFYGQMLFTKALQVEEAGIIAVVRCSAELVLAFVFQITFFHEIPDTCTVIGALLVASAVVFTSFRKYIITLPGDHVFRRWFGFTLK